MSDPLNPGVALLCKLGSIAVHLEEYMSDSGVELDLTAAATIVNDLEVQEWTKGMNELALLPLKRG